MIVIDKILEIQVDPNRYNNECNALIHLRSGLLALYNSVKPLELSINEKHSGLSFFGHNPELIPDESYFMLPSIYHWFALSIVNYSRLVGYIVARDQGHVTDADLQLKPERVKIKKACNAYIESLSDIKEVLKWRNKVAAHYALTDPRPDDNISTLEASIIYPVSFDDGRFRTGMWIYSKGEGLDSEIPSWSLTEIFELLSKRYWPDIEFNPPL